MLVADAATLQRLLAATGGAAAIPATEPSERAAPVGALEAHDAEVVERWLGHVGRYEGRALERELGVAWSELGGLPFLERLVARFLRELGERWAAGRIGVRHEHCASERLREFLTCEWCPLADAATGPVLVLATPAGEHHVLGLHMAAVLLAAHNARIVFLGADAPAQEIAGAVAHHGASALAGAERGRGDEPPAGRA